MGTIKHYVEVTDKEHYIPEFNEDGTEKHIPLDGARFHVIGYDSFGPKCSCKNCEINKMRKEPTA